MSSNEHPHIEGYRILRVIGHGGMSTVYLAEQASLGRKVALKVMLPEALADEVSRGRFENEARTIARMEHPNIVGIHEVGRTADGLPFYSMSFLARGHLAQRDLRGDQQKAAAILRALLPALDYAHVRGVVHRDVKAENVLFDDTERPLLADFGIALRRGSNPRLTTTGLAVGSTAYMPPEQARGGDVDRRADLYSIGVLTWEMLTGRLPYNAGDALSMALKHVQDPIPRLPAPLKHWQDFIDKALAKQPGGRFSNAHDMLDALDELEKRAGRNFGVVEVRMPAIDTAAAEPAGGFGWARWAFGLAALVAIGFGIFQFIGGREGGPAPMQATADTDASTTADALPAPAADAQTGLFDAAAPVDGSGIGAYLANAEQQLREGRVLAPPNGNAWDSLDAAWRVDATHPQAQLLTARLFDALGELAERGLRNGDTGSARVAFERARELDARRGGDGSAIILLRQRLDDAFGARIDALIAKPDRAAATALLADTAWLGTDGARRKASQARLARLPAVAVAPATRIAANAQAQPASIQLHVVSRSEYARFADATGRAAVECGRRGLFGRKRDWKSTGGDAAPVACVSAADAQAYAAWLSASEKHRYRLPTAGELRAQATSPISAWLTLCGNAACTQRMASGKPQALDASRGYNDVGIRLVREG